MHRLRTTVGFYDSFDMQEFINLLKLVDSDTPSTVFWEIPQPLPQSQKKKAVYTHKEVFGDFTIEPFTLEEALEALEISELEFQKRLESKGLRSIDDFDREGEFPVEWVKGS